MTDYQVVIDQISIQYNLLSLFIFTGIVLGLMMSSIIFLKKVAENRAILFLGAIVLFLSFIMLDFFLSQTGLMKYVLWLNNSTEVFALLIPICAYFFILEVLSPEKETSASFKLHFIVPCLYFLTQIGTFIAPKTTRLNAYLNGFHPNLPLVTYEETPLRSLSYIFSPFFHYLLIGTFLVYLFLSVKIIRTYNEKIHEHFSPSKPKWHKYNFSIYLVALLGVAAITAAAIFMTFETDLGEQYLMIIPLGSILALGFLMMSGVPIFDKAWLLEKYHTSGLNISSSDILEEIVAFVEGEQYYLKKDGSLKDLADQLAMSPTYLSQIINKQTNQNFNDFINHYRIEVVKTRLTDEVYQHLTIAGIGETVGFKSKSSFYAVFKKHTHLTPAAYIKVANDDEPPELSPES